jgi:hypothetical protein
MFKLSIKCNVYYNIYVIEKPKTDNRSRVVCTSVSYSGNQGLNSV